MNVLIACEESQEVCKAFRAKGHRAFSCDIQECSGGHPEWHILGDVLPLLNGKTTFNTMDGEIHEIKDRWDMIIAHPPCTHLAVSGARHFAAKRADGRQREAIEFFCQFLEADCDKVVVENPVCIISGSYLKEHFPDLAERYGLPQKPAQMIQPYEFGERARKKTCLWEKGVQPLVPTEVVDCGPLAGNGRSVNASIDTAYDENGKTIRWSDPRTAKARSKTFPGIAKAMAEQWG